MSDKQDVVQSEIAAIIDAASKAGGSFASSFGFTEAANRMASSAADLIQEKVGLIKAQTEQYKTQSKLSAEANKAKAEREDRDALLNMLSEPLRNEMALKLLKAKGIE